MAQRRRGGQPRHVLVSQAATDVLRHHACGLGLVLRPDGFLPVAQLLATPEFLELGVSSDELAGIVEGSGKLRFEVQVEDDGTSVIRAVQGHSIKGLQDELMLRGLYSGDADVPTDAPEGA